MSDAVAGVRVVSEGVICVQCPECETSYVLSTLIKEIKKLSPHVFEFDRWSTGFVCKECRAKVTLTGTAADLDPDQVPVKTGIRCAFCQLLPASKGQGATATFAIGEQSSRTETVIVPRCFDCSRALGIANRAAYFQIIRWGLALALLALIALLILAIAKSETDWLLTIERLQSHAFLLLVASLALGFIASGIASALDFPLPALHRTVDPANYDQHRRTIIHQRKIVETHEFVVVAKAKGWRYLHFR